jgi:3-oxoacyl-[acyl-carrier-protein] synthase II
LTSNTEQRIVVTGLGATTPVGANVAETWEAVLAGQSGVTLMPFDWVETYELPVKIAATIKQSPLGVLSRVEARRLDPAGQYALIASREAWADAGTPEMEPERLGVVIGTGIGGVHTLLDQWDTLREKGVRRIFPLAVPMLIVNGPAAAVSIELGARAGAHAPVSACSSGAEAIGYAMHPMPIAGFAAMKALSTRNDDPAAASRPYDTARDGFVLGEGAAVVVLESEAHARARGARIYAEVAGVGMSSDAYHIAAPDPTGAGAARAMHDAVKNAGLSPKDIVHINAHATSTPVGDIAESNAIRLAFGDDVDHMPVSATKSLTGHLLGAAGALEAVFTILAIHQRLAPATINLDDFDPAIELDVVHGEHRKLPEGDIAALNNSFGFGGHNLALTIRSV